MTYLCTITGDANLTAPYDEPTAVLLLSQALEKGFTLTADPAAPSVTVTLNGRTVTLNPAAPLPKLTPAQRKALLALADNPRAPLTWVYSERNVPHLEHGGHPLNRSVSMSLLEAGYVTGPEHGHDTALTLLARLAVGRLRNDPATLTALLRNTYAPARTH